MLDGKYDTIVAGMSITDERDEVIDFTRPYIPPSRSVYVAANVKAAAQVATIQASYLMSQTGVMVTVQTCGDLPTIGPIVEGQPSTVFPLQTVSVPSNVNSYG